MEKLDYLELPVHALGGCQTFYEAAFGWRFTVYGHAYSTYEEGDCELALNAIPDGKTAQIFPLIRTDDLEGARQRVQEAGGTIVLEIYPYPGGRRFHFTDPSGHEMGVYQPD